MSFLIVTGVSGAGKSRAVSVLEDLGFYCVDNMPPSLIPKFAELCMQTNGKISNVAIVTDVRGGLLFNSLFENLDELKKLGGDYKILFLDADDQVLIRRFKETRRMHPLSLGGITVTEALRKERMMLKPARERADFIIDTSSLSPTQLKERLSVLFVGGSKTAVIVNCQSFGFKFGIPADADLVFDVRCLPNPFYVDSLKQLTGLDEPVRQFVLRAPETQGFITRMFDLIDYLYPLYCEEGKSQLVVAIGCTGGRHRSVALTEELFKHLLERGIRAAVNHRDVKLT
ncbi:MAG: RNase adapter RapZ [Clostridia bacterium]|nr:RNase adapter RapZ [Clostridia bacterium]MDR3643713.1 RNase adapter RapZ [Clostridia bacterium]